jgi:hypothetical protein
MGSFVAVQRFLLPQTLFSEGVACQSHKLKAADSWYREAEKPCAGVE